MSALSEALSAIREAVRLADDVKRAGDTLKDLARELRDHDRRITRLEAQWETAMALARGPRGGGGAGPRRLEGGDA
ncbi:MAG: hypothetical protein HYZ20_12880 [Burkholderiales bacterium]|nr:hypothetical protein [Burkholderiales bacterium]